jgi:hypothetical protein
LVGLGAESCVRGFRQVLCELRSQVGIHLAAIAMMYGLDIEEEPAAILAPKPENGDARPAPAV